MAQLRLPLPRGIAVALLFLLTVTAVHGAASVAVPAVAIAGGPASIGAALLHHTLTPSGRSGSDDSTLERERQTADDQPRPAGSDHGDPPAPAVLPGWSVGTGVDAPAVRSQRDDLAGRQHNGSGGSRAPPHGPSTASSTLG